jgi:hypothetical protein
MESEGEEAVLAVDERPWLASRKLASRRLASRWLASQWLASVKAAPR